MASSLRRGGREALNEPGPWLTGEVEHIGSTAVPGLAAKPILDMLAPVDDLDGARAALPALADLGYRHVDRRPHEALWFFKQQGEDYGTRTHQLHLSRPDSALWRERLTFRGCLARRAGSAHRVPGPQAGTGV